MVASLAPIRKRGGQVPPEVLRSAAIIAAAMRAIGIIALVRPGARGGAPACRLDCVQWALLCLARNAQQRCAAPIRVQLQIGVQVILAATGLDAARPSGQGAAK